MLKKGDYLRCKEKYQDPFSVSDADYSLLPEKEYQVGHIQDDCVWMKHGHGSGTFKFSMEITKDFLQYSYLWEFFYTQTETRKLKLKYLNENNKG